MCRGAEEEAVCERARTAKVVESGGEEEHILVNHRLDDGGVGRGVTTMKLQPLGKVMRASSGSRCERCITLVGGRRRDGDIDDSVGEGVGDHLSQGHQEVLLHRRVRVLVDRYRRGRMRHVNDTNPRLDLRLPDLVLDRPGDIDEGLLSRCLNIEFLHLWHFLTSLRAAVWLKSSISEIIFKKKKKIAETLLTSPLQRSRFRPKTTIFCRSGRQNTLNMAFMRSAA